MTTTLRWALLALSLIVGVAALLRMAGPATAGHDALSGAIRLPTLVTVTILALFAVAGLVFLLALVRRMRSRRHGQDEELFGADQTPVPPWMRTVTQMLSLLNILIIAYLVWRGVIPLADLMSLGAGAAGAPAPLQPPPLDAPFLVTWTFGALALTAGLAALALALWVAFGDRLAEWWEQRGQSPPQPRPAVAPAEESLDALRAESDPRRAIIRCYGKFERVAAGSGVERKSWHTPAEFMREALARLVVPRGAVPTLTGLFELARFSHRELGRPDRDRALGALGEITAAIERREVDGATP
jgi:hypothetical protein